MVVACSWAQAITVGSCRGRGSSSLAIAGHGRSLLAAEGREPLSLVGHWLSFMVAAEA